MIQRPSVFEKQNIKICFIMVLQIENCSFKLHEDDNQQSITVLYIHR